MKSLHKKFSDVARGYHHADRTIADLLDELFAVVEQHYASAQPAGVTDGDVGVVTATLTPVNEQARSFASFVRSGAFDMGDREMVARKFEHLANAIERLWRMIQSDLSVGDFDLAGETVKPEEKPVDLLLFCPACNSQHIDAPEEAWANLPHRSHLCHNCGVIWRPADVATNGVASIKTAGNRDTHAARPKVTTFKAPRREMPSDEEIQKLAKLHGFGGFGMMPQFIRAALRAFPVRAEQPPKVEPDEGSHHLFDGEFQSDKYPTTPRGKVPLSVKDPTAQDLLWQYAQRRREVDENFANDLQTALINVGYLPAAQPTKVEARDVDFDTALAKVIKERFPQLTSAPPPAPVYDEAAERESFGKWVKGYYDEHGVNPPGSYIWLARAKLGTVQADPERERLRDAVIGETRAAVRFGAFVCPALDALAAYEAKETRK